MTGQHVVVTDWLGKVVYDGVGPVPAAYSDPTYHVERSGFGDNPWPSMTVEELDAQAAEWAAERRDPWPNEQAARWWHRLWAFAARLLVPNRKLRAP